MIETLAQMRARGDKPFTAGIVLWDDVVIEAAPIVGYMKRQKWSRDRVRTYCEKQGWEITVVREVVRHDIDELGRNLAEVAKTRQRR